MKIVECVCGWESDRLIDNCLVCGKLLRIHVPNLYCSGGCGE